MSEKYNIPEPNSLDSMEGVDGREELKPRKIFIEPDIVEPSVLTHEREIKFKKDFVDTNGEQNTAEWESFLKDINFPKLRKIFSDYLEQLGFIVKELNFLEPDRLFSAKNTMNSGEYFPFYNSIVFGSIEPQIDVFVKSQETINERRSQLEQEFGSLDILRLATLIHEETHAISQRECLGIYGSIIYREDGYRFSQTGFNQEYRTRPQDGQYRSPFYYEDGVNFFGLLNEAITEQIARKITLMYLEDSGEKDSVETYRKTCNENSNRHYKLEIDLIRRIINVISSKTNFSEIEIWRMLEKGYFNGERFDSGDMKRIFDDVFGAEFVVELSSLNLHYYSSFTDFIRKYNL